jgi:hypothetical protein
MGGFGAVFNAVDPYYECFTKENRPAFIAGEAAGILTGVGLLKFAARGFRKLLSTSTTKTGAAKSAGAAETGSTALSGVDDVLSGLSKGKQRFVRTVPDEASPTVSSLSSLRAVAPRRGRTSTEPSSSVATGYRSASGATLGPAARPSTSECPTAPSTGST